MPLSKQPYTSYNWFFLVPFILWVFIAFPFTDGKYLQLCFAAVNTHHNPFADFLMYYTTWIGEGITITIILTTLFIFPAFRNWWYFITALLCNVLPTIVTQSIKNIIDAPRPLKYFGEASWIHLDPSWPKLFSYSFPSGHTTGAFSMFCLLAMLLPKKYKPLGVLFFFLSLSVAYSRIYLAAHFLKDVYWGSIIGVSSSLLVFAIMQYFKPYFFRKESVTSKQ